VRALLANGQAYEHASRTFIDRFWGVVREENVGVYTDASRTVWTVGAAICGVGFLVVFVEKGIQLRMELKSEYGMKVQKKTNNGDAGVEAGFRFLIFVWQPSLKSVGEKERVVGIFVESHKFINNVAFPIRNDSRFIPTSRFKNAQNTTLYTS
jgi:hypothetical protein